MIFVEGPSDVNLLMALGIAKKEIRKFEGKGNVCNALKKSNFVKGLLDEDPGKAQPHYFNEMEKIEEDQNLIKYVDAKRSNKIIVIKPEMEEWLLFVFKKNNIEHSYPNEVKYFKREILRRTKEFKEKINDHAHVAALDKLKKYLQE